MSNVKQFGRRGPVRQSFGSNQVTAVHQPVRIPLPVIVLVALGIFAAGVWGLPGSRQPGEATPLASIEGDTVSASFDYCVKGQGFNCVIDGDTFRYRGQSIRIADINTPETYRAECASEKALGDRATRRMYELLNDGPFQILPYERDTDKYGRQLRIIARGGQSLGMILVNEGLAEKWKGYRSSWCG